MAGITAEELGITPESIGVEELSYDFDMGFCHNSIMFNHCGQTYAAQTAFFNLEPLQQVIDILTAQYIQTGENIFGREISVSQYQQYLTEEVSAWIDASERIPWETLTGFGDYLYGYLWEYVTTQEQSDALCFLEPIIEGLQYIDPETGYDYGDYIVDAIYMVEHSRLSHSLKQSVYNGVMVANASMRLWNLDIFEE